MTIWYRQSSKIGFNLVPVGFKGWIIFLANFFLLFFAVISLSVNTTGPKFLPLIALIMAIALFYYSYRYKSDFTPK